MFVTTEKPIETKEHLITALVEVIFSLFSGVFKSMKEAEMFVKELDSLCGKYDPTGENISFDYDFENCSIH